MSNSPKIGRPSSKPLVSDYLGESPSARDAPSALPLFQEDLSDECQPVDHTAIVAANVPKLFGIRSRFLTRVGTAQTNHYGNVAPGIRRTPKVRHDIPIDSDILRSFSYSRVQSRDNKVIYAIASIWPRNHTFFTVDINSGATSRSVVPTGQQANYSILHNVVTDQGFAISTQSVHRPQDVVITHFDVKKNSVLWSKRSPHEETVNLLLQIPSGDLVALCGLTTSPESQTGHLVRFDGLTGDIKYETPWELPRLLKTFSGSFDTATLKPQILSYDHVENRCVIALTPYDPIDDTQLYQLSLEKGEIESVGTLPASLRRTVACPLKNGAVVFVPSAEEALEDTTLLTLESVSTPSGVFFKSFNRHIGPLESKRKPLMTNDNSNFAVRVESDGFSIFAIDENEFRLVRKVQFSGANQEDRRLQSEYVAMTRDDVIYYSRHIRYSGNGLRTCRLYAYDAKEGKELWTVDQDFDVHSTPVVLVNCDGSVTWASDQRAVVYEAAPGR